jgi:hypothetical protein
MQPNPEQVPAEDAPPEQVLEVFDDAAPPDLFQQACAVCQGNGWYFGHGTARKLEARFWKMDLDGNPVFAAIWEHVRPRCEALAGAPLRVIRQYANGHTYGLGGRTHADDERPGTFTFLYYPMPEWDDAWEGETVYYDAAGEIVFSTRPRPNRGLFFDSRIPHVGRAPSRSCHALRVTVAYKLEIASQPAGTKTAGEPATAPEHIRRDGATRIEKVRIPAAEVDAAVATRMESLAKTVRLPGYRPGQIPAEILQQRYGQETRKEVVDRLSAAAVARTLAERICPASVVLKSGEKSGDVELEIAGTVLADLPDHDFSKIPLERLTVTEASAQAAGMTLDKAMELVRSDLKNQVLDRLDATYRIPIAPFLVERELFAIWKAVEAAGEAPADAKDRVGKRNELRPIAERRVRLGWLVTELARRAAIVAQNGPELEEKAITHIVSLAQVTEREASEEDLRDLATE